MDLPIAAPVTCSDGGHSQSTAIILNPVSEHVTHLVVREPGLFGVERMVPIELVRSSTPEQIDLLCTRDALAQLAPFVSQHYMPPSQRFIAVYGASAVAWPYVSNDSAEEYDQENADEGELTIHRGAEVHASDGQVGVIEELMVTPSSSAITHLVLREGHIWAQQRVVIPVDQIDRIGDNAIYLKLTRQQVAALPEQVSAKRAG